MEIRRCIWHYCTILTIYMKPFQLFPSTSFMDVLASYTPFHQSTVKLYDSWFGCVGSTGMLKLCCIATRNTFIKLPQAHSTCVWLWALGLRNKKKSVPMQVKPTLMPVNLSQSFAFQGIINAHSLHVQQILHQRTTCVHASRAVEWAVPSTKACTARSTLFSKCCRTKAISLLLLFGTTALTALI